MSITVAVVDDDVRILDAIELVLDLQGWSVKSYTSGEAFLDEIDRYELNCLILDPHLPGMSGADVARSLSGSHRDLPILGITARPNSPITNDLGAAGALVILKKPVSEKNLVDSIQAALNGRL